jgi:amino acid transporter
MHKKISLFSLVLLIVAAIDSIRNLPSAALFGSSLIFFFILSALIFLIPTSLVAAQLSATFPNEGGIYHWVRSAFGAKMGMLAIWLQWINTMVWYPTILSFIAGTAAYLIDPNLVNNRGYLITMVLSIFWGLTIVNLFGLNISTKVNNVCGLIGMMFPMTLLVILGFVWLAFSKPMQIHFNLSTMLPSFSSPDNWVSLVAIMASFLGMELSGVHVNDIHNPQKNFPKALFISGSFILFSMLFGSLAIAVVLPSGDINLISGVMQVFQNFFQAFHMSWFVPVIAILIVVGSVGGMTNWLISPAKGLLHASESGFMPPFFAKKNRYGVASRILYLQAILVTLICFAFLFMPSVNSFYWFLTTLSTQLYMMMYLLMFFAAVKVYYAYETGRVSFKIPGGKWGISAISLLGTFGCLLTIAIGFFPPDNLGITSGKTYAAMIGGGNLLMIAPVLLFYFYKSLKR